MDHVNYQDADLLFEDNTSCIHISYQILDCIQQN